jgi:hypothetical protein
MILPSGRRRSRGKERAMKRASLYFAAVCFCLCTSARALGQEPESPFPATRVLSYEIRVELDDTAKMLHGRENIVWMNRTGEAVPDMLFHLYWNAFKNEKSAFFEEALEETPGGRALLPGDGEWGWIDVTDVRLADGPDLTSTMEYVAADRPRHPGDQTVMRVRFPEPVKPGHDVRLRLEFRSKIPRAVDRSGYYGSSYFIGQWFPKPGVYEEGRGWNCHAYHLNSEFFADFADFTVHIDVPERFVVGACGRESGLTVDAASGRATHTFRQAMIHDFAWTADPRFIRVERPFIAAREVTPREYADTAALLGVPEDEVKLPDVRMILFIEPEHRAQIDRHFKALREAIKYYGLWYGPYPYETITMIDPPFRTKSGGMEYPTLFTAGTHVLLSRGVLEPEGVIVHEFGHNYWYGMVANNEFEEAWLDEGLNTYSTGRVLARAYGRGRLPFDLNGIPLAGFLGMPRTLDFETDRAAAIRIVAVDSVIRDSWHFRDSMSYGANVYDRAATCLNTLERLLGERTMARVMRAYFSRYRFRHPRSADFMAVVNEVAGQDMDRFFRILLMNTLDFDYGIESCVSEEKPALARSVFDVDGRKAEANSGAPPPAGPGGPAPREYVTTVTLGRYGEAVIGGQTGIKLVVSFEDGSRETRLWDGRDRWTRFTFVKPARATGAVIDPETVWLIDSNIANNSYRVAPARKGLTALAARLLGLVQNVLQWVSTVS